MLEEQASEKILDPAASESSENARNGAEKRRNPDEPAAVVGLGASAGGIAVLQQFFSDMSPESGLAFVVVMHLSPEHESNLANVIKQKTSMPVTQVNGPVKVKPNHIYVIPPNHQLTFEDSTLQLVAPQQAPGRRVTIDLFFRTLAQAYGQRAVGVILSGSDADGAIGLKHVRAQGGVTIAQDPNEAEHDSMPQTAINTGMVDWVLPVADMPPRLMEFVRNENLMTLPPEDLDSKDPEAKDPEAPGGETVSNIRHLGRDESALRDALAFVRVQTGHDFSHYKRATLLRRVARRMQVNSMETIPRYRDFLRQHPVEARALLQDLLIGVTHFFRDQESFAALEANIPQLFAGRRAEGQIRVWVAGCASGEEAYSIAILLCEYAERLEEPPSIQIFASDLDEHAIQDARSGLYPATIETDVSQDRLRRFFDRDQGGYRVKKSLREKILFASHNLLKDPPFSRIDLISCRNLLIYLNKAAQEQVFDLFHYALRPSGLLFIGGSETGGENVHSLFSPMDGKHRIFVRRSVPRPNWRVPLLPSIDVPAGHSEPAMRSRTLPALTRRGLQQAASDTEESHLARHERRSVLLGELHLKLLEEYGPPSVVVNEAHEIMHLSSKAGRYLHFGAGEPTANLMKVAYPALRVELRTALFRAEQTQENVHSPPQVVEIDGVQETIVVEIRPMLSTDPAKGFFLVLFHKQSEPSIPAPPGQEDIARPGLDEENQFLKEQLDATVERYEISHEELRASNEELQAVNEEMHSATEELETSKEELQSLNEELTTVNHELKTSVEDLSRANADLNNLMASTDIGTIFLDRQLRIQRFTPSAQKIFNLLPADLGRPLTDITSKLAYPDFIRESKSVLNDLATTEREVRLGEDTWYLVRIAPYRTQEDRIAGVVATFVDITRRKHTEETLRESQSSLVETARRQEALYQFVHRRHEAKSLQEIYAAALDVTLAVLNCDRAAVLFFDEKDVMRFVDFRGVSEKYRKAVDGHSPWKRSEKDPRPMCFEDVEVADVPASLKTVLRAEGIKALMFIPLVAEAKLIGKLVAYYDAPHVCSESELGFALTIAGQLAVSVERKRAEETVRQAEERFRLLVEGAKDYAMFLVDPDNIITFWSSGAERLFGWSRTEAEGRSAALIFTPEDRAQGAVEQEISLALREGSALDRRWHVRKDGSRFWTDGVMTRLEDDSGGVRGLAKIARDATIERNAEEAVRRARDEMEQRVIERTRDLVATNTELERTIAQRQQLERELLQISEREKRRVGEDLHDMVCQELTATALFLKSQSRNLEKENSKASDALEEAAQTVNRNVSIARELARGLQAVDPTAAGLKNALRALATQVSKRSGIQCQFKAARGVRVPNDTVALHFYRIAQEAVANAVKHSRAKNILIHLDHNPDQTCISVQDDGKGFTPGGRRKKGLGLHMMRYRANVLGGELKMERRKTGGTDITCVISQKSAERDQAQA